MLLFPRHLSITWYLAFLAADWSGLSVPLRSNFSLVAPWSLRPAPDPPGRPLISTDSTTFLASPFLSLFFPLFPSCCCALALRVPFFFLALLCLSSFFSLSFPFFSASDSSGRRLVRVVRALAPPLSLSFSLFLVPFGCCAWSFWPQTGPDFQRHPHLPLFLPSCTSLIPGLIARRDLSFSVVPLAADWSGVSLCWLLSFTIPSFKTKHVLWPQTGPGRCLSPQTHGTPHKTASRADMV